MIYISDTYDGLSRNFGLVAFEYNLSILKHSLLIIHSQDQDISLNLLQSGLNIGEGVQIKVNPAEVQNERHVLTTISYPHFLNCDLAHRRRHRRRHRHSLGVTQVWGEGEKEDRWKCWDEWNNVLTDG